MEITVQDVLNKLVIDSSFKTKNTDIELYSDPSFNLQSIENGNDKELIIKSITYLFENSSIAKQYFEQFVNDSNTPNIEINYVENNFQVRSRNNPNSPNDKFIKIELDFAKISNFGYLTPDGKAAKYFPELALMHEMIHAITALTDNPLKDDQDFHQNSAGSTQKEANKIHKELGIPERVSYLSTLDVRTYKPGTDFTNEKEIDDNFSDEIKIDIGVVLFESLDTSNNDPATRDLIVGGGSRSRVFKSGNGNDYLYGAKVNDTLDGGGDNDYLDGDKGEDVLKGGSGNDTLYGNEGNDELDGGAGEDVAVFTEEYKTQNYDYEDNENGSITITHKNNGIDGVDTLKNIEWGRFNGEQEAISNLSFLTQPTENKPRIIPLPLEDGIANTVSEQVYVEPPAYFTSAPVTPPYVSLTAPISMLDGDIDYTLNISPYKPDTQYNISYIFDTSGSMDAEELQTAKDAYIDLINYYIDTGVADKSNFSVISFSRFANPYFNLTGEQAISIIQNLTTAPTSEGTKYNDALHQGLNFLAQSLLNLLNTFYRRFQLNREWFQLASL